MSIQAIFWDNDGVLVDTEKKYYEATKQTLASLGIELTKQMFIDLFLEKGMGAFHLAEAKGIPKSEIVKLREDRNNLYNHLLSQGKYLINNVKEVLKKLHNKYNKYKMALVTSSRREHFDIIHKSTNIIHYFDFIITRENYLKSKPDPEPYLLAVKKCGYKNEECLAVEDSRRGLMSAKSANVKCFIVPTDLTKNQDFSEADKILKEIKEILLYL